MKNLIKIIFLAIVYILSVNIMPSNLDKLLYFLLMISVFAQTLVYPFNRLSYSIAFVLIGGSALLFFLDNTQIRFVHYIYKPSTWSFYFILAGLIGDIIRNYKTKI